MTNTFQDSLIQYGGYTGGATGVFLPIPAGGMQTYYTGNQVSQGSGSFTLYTVPIVGDIGDTFYLDVSGFNSNTNSTISLTIGSTTSTYLIPNSGGSFQYYAQFTIIDNTYARILVKTSASNAFSIGNMNVGANSTERCSTGQVNGDLISGDTLTLAKSGTGSVDVYQFTITKVSPP